MTDTITPVLSRIDADLPQALDRLAALLRIPSISTDPAHKPDVEAAADWLVKDLTDMGFSARKRPDHRPSDGGGDRRLGNRPASAVLRPLRCTAGGPAAPVGPRPVRPRSAGNRTRKSDPRARRIG